MDDDYGRTYGIDKLAELLIERGIEFFVKDEVSLAFKDDVGSWHECWMAGADESHVNALIVVTPEQLLSVPDINGIITENERLTEQCSRLLDKTLEMADENARLKESLEESERDESMAWDRTRKAETENARLRELCNGYHHCLMSGICATCPLWTDGNECKMDKLLDELGIEAEL